MKLRAASPSSSVRTAAAVALLLALAACEYPTDVPIIDTRWVAPVESTRFGVGDLLPGSVTIPADSSAFVVDFDPASFGTSLGALCPPCVLASGFTVPKPAFTGTFGSDIDFPAEVSSVTVESGTVSVSITNGLNFDPINPAAGSVGGFDIDLLDGADGDTVATVSVDGSTTSFAPGTTLDLTVPLRAVTIDGTIDVSVSIDSPLGDPVTVDPDLALSVTATVDSVRVSEVAIDVSSEAVDLDPASFDLDDFGDEIQDRVTSGALVLDVRNPFGVGADFDLEITGPTLTTIQRALSLDGLAEESERIEFTNAEIRDILGQTSIVISGGAVVDPAAGIVRVQPGEELVLDARLDVVIRAGG